MTIGKIYCAKLIYENYKHMKKKRLEKKKKVNRSNNIFKIHRHLQKLKSFSNIRIIFKCMSTMQT